VELDKVRGNGNRDIFLFAEFRKNNFTKAVVILSDFFLIIMEYCSFPTLYSK